ncbi:NDR1/HIN1-like protein 10 [Gastrolobium bilobum]|uniref:NDR1/HIN1-like protein 10 n=1 Tax=Gastrolobium bilobum TaxID=150636 RepID=UPI002AB3227B|nr:NDR1/HIN1-like protein 10 [Gastrolobium bilobum]
MYEKQPQLNGAYYGPSIPPQKSYHRPSRGGGCDCCCGCIFNLIFKLILTVVFIVGIAVFLFWLIVRPNVVKVHVTDASLSQFNYTGDTLNYDLALNITVRNPNKRLGIYYDYIEARALFQDARFDSDFLDPFYQGHKTTNVLNPVFKGQQVIALNADQTSELNKEKNSGVYVIDVKLYLRVRFKLGVFKTKTLKPKISCDLQIPSSPAAGIFQTTKCDWDR